MTLSIFLNLLGLFITMVASILMLSSYIKIRRNVEEEFIENMDKNGNYTQTKHLKNRKLGISGFILYILGFSLQFISVLLII